MELGMIYDTEWRLRVIYCITARIAMRGAGTY